jgi:hypothetical protein
MGRHSVDFDLIEYHQRGVDYHEEQKQRTLALVAQLMVANSGQLTLFNAEDY